MTHFARSSVAITYMPFAELTLPGVVGLALLIQSGRTPNADSLVNVLPMRRSSTLCAAWRAGLSGAALMISVLQRKRETIGPSSAFLTHLHGTFSSSIHFIGPI